jgi:hypothetical protein
MEKHKKKKSLQSPYHGYIGAMVLLGLVSLSGLYTPSFGAQQSATIAIASSIEETTTVPPSGTTNASAAVISNDTTATMASNATLVEFDSNIEMIRGHLDEALLNKESGNGTLALAHVLHPIAEIYSNIQDQLANQDTTLDETLSAALQNLSSTVANTTLEDVDRQIDNVNMLLNNTVAAIVTSSEFGSSPAFNSSVVARLLDTASGEYEEGVENGTVKSIVEYQDAQGFINRSESLFNSTANRIDQSVAQEVGKVRELLSILNGQVSNNDDHAAVETTINGIIDELTEITGLPRTQLVGEETGEAAEQDPVAIINNIKTLLTQQLLPAYTSQDYEAAENIAIEAYLENYENIEVPLAEHDRPLMEQTELMLREDLRQMIMDRVSAEQLEQQVNMIIANLDKAAELFHQ